MHKHPNPSHHSNILMFGHRGHHADGGLSSNSMPSNPSHYKKGGKTHHRRHHAEGEGVNPVTGVKTPALADNITEKRKGGRACHAEGDMIRPYRHGGKTRKRHADGDEIQGQKIEAMQPMRAMHRTGLLGRTMQAEGGKTEALRRGGRTHRRRHHHEEGGIEEKEKMYRGGMKKKNHDMKRSHHDFGDTIGNIGAGLLHALPSILPFFLAEGGSASTKNTMRRGGRTRKHHSYGGVQKFVGNMSDAIQPFYAKGGRTKRCK